jgi:tetratricopeptide (TPR) repeat protein
LLAIPRSISTGLYNDDYQASLDLLHPFTTLPAALLVTALLVAAWCWRFRHPRLSAALTFYFAGHLLESTAVPLELYFEHRNYLPAMLLFWPLAAAVVDWNRSVRWRAALAGALLLLCAVVTWQRASLWGQPELLAKTWAVRNPDSPRALATAALILTRAGEPERAAAMLWPAWQQRPEEVQLAFNYINARCAAGDRALRRAELAAVTNTLKQARQGHLMIHQWLQQAMVVANDHTCAGLSLEAVESWISVVSANPALAAPETRGQDIEPLLGELAVYRRDPAVAAMHFRKALMSYPNPDFAARLITFLAAHEQYAVALSLLNEFQNAPRNAASHGMPRLHVLVLEKQGFWQHEFAVLREKLEAEIARQPPHDVSATTAPDSP